MKTLVLLGAFCTAVVNANNFNGGGFYPYYSDGYVVEHRPLLQRPLGPGVVGGPGGSVIFSGTGDVQAAGTGLGFFAGQGEVGFNGDLNTGVFMGRGDAQLDGAGQIQVSTVPGVGVVGNVQNFQGQADFQGNGVFAGVGTGAWNAQGSGVGGFAGNGVVGVNGVGQTNIRGGRNYSPVYNSVYPSYSYPSYRPTYATTYRPTYGNAYATTYRPTYGNAYGTTYRPTYRPTYETTYRPTYRPTHTKNAGRTGRFIPWCGGLFFPFC